MINTCFVYRYSNNPHTTTQGPRPPYTCFSITNWSLTDHILSCWNKVWSQNFLNIMFQVTSCYVRWKLCVIGVKSIWEGNILKTEGTTILSLEEQKKVAVALCVMQHCMDTLQIFYYIESLLQSSILQLRLSWLFSALCLSKFLNSKPSLHSHAFF